MSIIIQSDQIRALQMGIAVYKTAFNLPQTTSTAMFTVTGGDIAIKALYGQVTTLLVGAVNLNITYTPSGGSAADMCAATTCDDDAVGTLYSLTTGIAADLLSEQSPSGSEAPNVTFANLLQQPLVVRAGAINLKASASRVGQTKWSLFYVPLDAGATVAAA